MSKKGYHADAIDEVSGEGVAPSLKPYSKETTAEGTGMLELDSIHKHKGYEPTHVIHKGHGGIEGANVEGYHHKK